MWPGVPLAVEVHRHPNQPYCLFAVSAERIFGVAMPSAIGIPGILAPEPAAHAVVLVAHAWSHEPLASAGPPLDVAALLASTDRWRAGAVARAWGWERMWNANLAVMDAVLGGKHPSLALELWARHVPDVRERVVLENHFSRLAAPAWSLPAAEVPRAVVCALLQTAAPESEEDWVRQLRRSCLAIAHAFRPGSEHKRSLAWIGPRATPRRPPAMSVRPPRSREPVLD
jgi:hypothetical protein